MHDGVTVKVDLATELKKVVGGEVRTDEQMLNETSGDFGRMIVRRPAVVVRPSSTEDVAQTIRLANRLGIHVSTRAEAHTQTGQALNEGGILLDMRSLDRILSVDPKAKLAVCQAGVVWRDLVEHLKPHRLIPPVLTNNLGVTIGGTHSVAGLGIASFRFGAQVDNTVEMEVVTGAGEIVVCSPDRNAEVFRSFRSALGQFGVITRATLKVREHLPMTRTYFLLYDDLRAIMDDSRALMDEERFDYLESWCVPCPQGFKSVDGGWQAFAQWFYPLQATIEFDPANPPDDAKLTKGLRHYRHVHTQDRTIHDFANRLEPLFVIWRRSGYWANTHPWMETILPWDTAEAYITQVLSNLPPQALGGGHILLWPSKGTTSHTPMFRTPPGQTHVMGFGILPGIPPQFIHEAKPKLNLASDLSMAMGAKRYLSGLVEFDHERWKAHFDELWPQVVAWKKQFDPKRLLNPGFIQWE
jgi:cytokinin dehydrogenase